LRSERRENVLLLIAKRLSKMYTFYFRRDPFRLAIALTIPTVFIGYFPGILKTLEI
jgi:hypothetical protein